MKKKWCVILLSLAMVLSVLSPLSALAADGTVTLTDTVITRVTPVAVTGQDQLNQPVYTVDYNALSGVARFTVAQNFASWTGQWWQDKMFFQVNGNDFAGDGFTFLVTASSEAFAEEVAAKFTLGFRTGTNQDNFTNINAAEVTSVRTPAGELAYLYRIPYSEMSNGSPVGYSNCYLTLSFTALTLHDMGNNTIGEYLEFSQIGAYREVETTLTMDEADVATVSVNTENGVSVDAAIANDAPADSRSYTGLTSASLQMHTASTLTLTANKATAKIFKGWKKDGVLLEGSTNELTVTDITDGVTYTAVYEDIPSQAPDGTDIFLGSPWTATAAKNTLQLELGEEMLINRVQINETSTAKTQTFHIEVLDGEEWVEVYDNDHIQAERTCILPEDVTTSAIRLVIDSMAGGNVVIGNLSADYQASTENPDFMHVGYITHQQYEMEWDKFSMTEDQYNILTDIIMINSFHFDRNGKFLITSQKDGKDYEPTSAEADAKMKEWIGFIADNSSHVREGKTRMWFSLMGLDAASKTSMALNDDATARAFAESVADFAEKHGFYGVDVDWEYPTSGLQAFHKTLDYLSEVLHERGLKLSCTLSVGYANFLNGKFDVLDYVNCMYYTNTNRNPANVYGQVTYRHMQDLINTAMSNGMKREQILLGLPYFGKLTDGTGNYAAETYLELLMAYLHDYDTDIVPKGLNRIYMNDIGFLYNGAYLLQDKVAYAAEMNFAGIMLWWPGQDIAAFRDGETVEVAPQENKTTTKGGVASDPFYLPGGTVSSENSLSRAVYEAVRRFTGVNPLRTDYTEMDATLAQVPEDLSIYTEESVAALQAAIDAIDFNLNYMETEQAMYDEMLANLKAALDALKLKSAAKRGDTDLNGEVNPLDALLALRVSVGLEELTDEQFAVTDLDEDGEITPLDALMILRISVGLDE